MRSNRRLTAAIAVVASLVVAAPVGTAAAAKKKGKPAVITISGATGSAPLVGQLAKKYSKGRNVKIKLAQGGGEVGIQDAASGKVTIGNAARDPRNSDPSSLKWYPIAKDSICFAVNKANGVTNLSLNTARDIWAGRIRNWSDVPGSKISGTIDIISRTGASSQPPLVRSLLLGGGSISSLASLKVSDGQVRQAILTNKNAIGHLSGVYTLDKKVTPLAHGGTACSPATVKSGQYPGIRTYYEVTKGAPTGEAKKFIDWIQRSKDAKKIISRLAVPLK